MTPFDPTSHWHHLSQQSKQTQHTRNNRHNPPTATTSVSYRLRQPTIHPSQPLPSISVPMEPLPSPPPPPPPPRQQQQQQHPLLPNSNNMDATTLDDPASSIWDLSYLLDFNLDDQISFPAVDLPTTPSPPPPPQPSDLDPPFHPQPHDVPTLPLNDTRVRKRDPRLTCSNFIAGRVPCACPELDAKLEEEGLPGKKRVRTSARGGSPARCQVPGCEADISELKGYHRRHRVCLRCANATTVVLHGEPKRYCQQCGKFHVLSDFDEGKRSCRRKLERHNNRRRRKPSDSRAPADHEPQPVTQTEDSNNDGEAGKDGSNLSSEINEKEVSLDHEDEPVAILSAAPEMQNIANDSVVSFVASGETQLNSGKDVSNISNSPSYCDNKSAYSSLCQTGRISFKLYDWNPAEFPRRLRHQIFQWLASMPLELEGYIRPGCTILTIFIAMPNNMWINLREDPLHYVCDLVAPRRMLSGRGTALVHLNDMIFHVRKDGTSVTKVEVNMQAPRLHYVHPTYFEAGKPMEFVACGSNLLQRKFRLLVSFSGKYLKCEYCVPSPHWTGDSISCAFDSQLYKIYVPHTEENLFGPAFIEVENESGLSNFIPVLIGDKEICTEMKTLQQKLDVSPLSKQFQSKSGGSICSSCEAFVHRHTSSSDLLVDIAWLLKEPTSENFDRVMSASQIQRYCYLLDFLICNDSTTILEKILPNLVILTESMKTNIVVNSTSNVDLTQLFNRIHGARQVIYQKCQKGRGIVVHSEMESFKVAQSSSQDNMPLVVKNKIQDILSRADSMLGALRSPTSNDKNDRMPLLKREIIMNVDEFPKKSCRPYLARRFFSTRPVIFVIASVAVCLGVCVAFLHHGKVTELAVSIRRCLFNYS